MRLVGFSQEVRMEASAWWFIIAAVLGIALVFTVEFTFAMLAVGALAAGFAAILGVPFGICIVIFAVVSAALTFFLRRPLMRKFKSQEPVVTGTAALIGKKARALDPITTRAGRIKLNGEVWSARTRSGEVAEDDYARVVEIEGATAIVEPDVEE
jgi:membrane protein implicated in regulation of membrane protease activity